MSARHRGGARTPRRRARTATGVGALAAAAVLGLSSCAPPGFNAENQAPLPEKTVKPLQDDETAEGFELDALVAAARQEGPITIYDETGKVTQIAEAFSEKYGIEAHGVKIEANGIDKVRREGESGNIIADVFAVSDAPAVYSDLYEDDILTNWVPGDVRDRLPEEARYPYLTSNNYLVWTYNSDTYGEQCPVSNIWQLTEPEWAGQVALPDPESRAVYTNIWSQAARNYSDEWAQAYEDRYGEELETDQPTAYHEWLVRLAANEPSIFKGDEEVSNAVGPPGQSRPPIGQMAAAKYRNNESKGYSLAPCYGLQPFSAGGMPQTMGYATGTDSPNAAKLYIHFATSQEGMEYIMPDGKVSYDPDVLPPDDRYGLQEHAEEFQPFDTDSPLADYRDTVYWQDLWRSSR
ncbi:ABC transporter substrate-binding protein [Rothia sp. AR01]|uniref:ABC transporter substrate-binding protein n=1 Tax=Rothia santali TaxID=2949643 RepID=A0A9X2KGW8_9MICC|nr:ABC transporter substrate-binding protein [Rothia santali]MCP3424568.1 ABC transporter substrate-binding protein [Rothia santali]